MTFSGGREFARGADRFAAVVAAIVRDAGFVPNARKTRVLTQATAQRATGLIVNRHPNVSRDTFDQLKAILHNCARHGAASQNRGAALDFRAHLMGRVAQLAHVNPQRGHKLERMLARIAWVDGYR